MIVVRMRGDDIIERLDAVLYQIGIDFAGALARSAVDQHIVAVAAKERCVSLPDIDEVMRRKQGICFDYSSLMAAMLRSQRIPTRLEFGYAGDAYHAWITTYIEDEGWINGIIESKKEDD